MARRQSVREEIMFGFTGKTIVVTGGAQGIGACIVQTFINQGAQVIFSDIDQKAGEERQKILNESCGAERSSFIHADLSEPSQINQFTKKINNQFSKIDVLINNAGIFSQKEMTKRSIDEWSQVIALNLSAMYLCVRAFHDALANAKGSIVNIASTRAFMSEENTEPYSASKGGVLALTHSQAISLGKKNIRVNCISPGWIDTAAWHLPPKKSMLRPIDHEQHPAGRVGKPEDIANAVLFLASNEMAGFITGQNIIIDGGMTKKMIYAE